MPLSPSANFQMTYGKYRAALERILFLKKLGPKFRYCNPYEFKLLNYLEKVKGISKKTPETNFFEMSGKKKRVSEETTRGVPE